MRTLWNYRGWIMTALVLVAVYFINVEVQTYLGQQTLNELNEDGLTAHTVAEARKIAAASVANSGRPRLILADLSAIWCPTCRKLDQAIFADRGVQTELEQNYVFARVEYESEAGEAFMRRYEVSGFPTLLVLNANGDLIRNLPVSFDPASFRNTLRNIHKNHAAP